MEQAHDIRTMVDEDISYCQEMWEAYSHDSQQMAKVFHTLFGRYKDEIDGFCKGLHVVELYEDSAQQAQTYRENVRLMAERLLGFRENGYENQGLMEYYIRKEHKEVPLSADFTGVRLEIGMMEGISSREKQEVIEKLDQMEDICSRVLFKGEKWNLMRGYLIWLSGKDVEIAMALLPLFFKVNG